jgi:hypothetical protein
MVAFASSASSLLDSSSKHDSSSEDDSCSHATSRGAQQQQQHAKAISSFLGHVQMYACAALPSATLSLPAGHLHAPETMWSGKPLQRV